MNIETLLPIADAWSMHGSGGWWVWMMLAMVLFWGAIIVGAVWFARGTANGWGSGRRQTPREILDGPHSRSEAREGPARWHR